MKNDLEYISDPSVLCGTEEYIRADGKAYGMKIIRIFNGKLQLLVKPGKCLDILRVDYCGKNTSYMTKNGAVSPFLAHSDAYNFINCFDGGFLYTCGPENLNYPSEYRGYTRPHHGSISNIPAENLIINSGFEADKYFISVSGTMKYTVLFGSKLALTRTIKLYYNESRFTLTDRLVNESFVDDEYMLLYHYNLGYPLLREAAELSVNSAACTCISPQAAKNFDRRLIMEKPSPGREEEVFCHTFNGADATAILNNGENSVGIKFNTDNLPCMMEWKAMQSGEYVLGIEPSTTSLFDIKRSPLAPGEEKLFSFQIDFT